MATYLQPCHWYEHDVHFKYVVDVFGRTNQGDIARLRLTGFCPYFYLRAETGETTASIASALTTGTKKQLNGIRITEERKLDAMKGFNGLTPTKVWKLSFPALWMFKLVARELKAGMRIGSRRVFTEDIYEAGLPPYLRLFHELDLSPASPLKFIADEETPPEGCRVDLCYTVMFREVEPYTKINIPLYVLSYDIETYSSVPGQFPVATNPKDEVIQIGMSFRWSDDLMTPVEKYVLVSGECSPSTDPTIKFISCRNEQDLLLKFQNTIHAENPDIIAGYNTFGFDDGYIAERCQKHKLELQLGREDVQSYSGDFVKTEKKTFELASGKYAVRYFDLCGRMPVDLLLVTRREQNLDSYKLDSVASTFLRDKVTSVKQLNDTTVEISTKSTRGLYVGNYVRFDVVTNTYNPYRDGEKFQVESVSPKSFIIRTTEAILVDLSEDYQSKLEWCFSKNDISIEDMFASHSGTPEQRSEVAKYCIQDCDLVVTLMAKLDTLVNARGMADVCRVPIDYIFLRGQGIKIFSAVVYNAHKRGQIIMTQESIDGETSYEGAIVLPPKIGLYLDQPIPVLDFNSLYPSNMIAFNLSPDTLVYVKTFNMDGRKIRHEGSDGVELQQLRDAGYVIDEVSYDTHNDTGESNGRVTCGFVQPRDSDPRTVGLLPMTLDILLKKRKETRKLMEITEDDAQISVLNGLQLAYKVVANSVYGQCGSRTSAIRKMEVAACTTALGRARIHEAKTVVETEFGATVIYGDSVADYTPVILKHNDIVEIMSISELSNYGTWKQCTDSDKEFCELNGFQSWTDDGWTDLERIIRHKLASHKKMIRVLTHTGLVDVTDDHSLLREDKTEVSPKDLKLGDSLLHHSYPSLEITDESRELFWNIIQSIDDQDIEITPENQKYCSELALMASIMGFNMHITDSEILTFTKNTQRKSPNQIKKMYEIPYEGYVYDLTTTNHHFQAGVGKMIVHNTDSIFVQFPTKDLAESIELGKKAAEKITSLCRKPYKIEYEKTFYPFIIFCRKRYVGLMYEDDITKCKRKTMGIALKRRDNAPIVKDIFGGALDMLLEERDLRKAHSFVKESLVNVMQNKIPLEKYVITKQLRDDYITEVPIEIRNHRNSSKPSDLNNPKASFHVIKDYAMKHGFELPKSSIAHRVLADRMTERDPGNKPQVGDRIPYVYIASKKDERKQGDRIEHLDYVRKHSLKPDVEFYITNQLQNPLAQLFALGIEQLEGYKPKNNYEKMFKEYRERMDEEESTLTVLKHKEKELDSLLFLGAPYLTKHKKGPMDAFLRR